MSDNLLRLPNLFVDTFLQGRLDLIPHLSRHLLDLSFGVLYRYLASLDVLLKLLDHRDHAIVHVAVDLLLIPFHRLDKLGRQRLGRIGTLVLHLLQHPGARRRDHERFPKPLTRLPAPIAMHGHCVGSRGVSERPDVIGKCRQRFHRLQRSEFRQVEIDHAACGANDEVALDFAVEFEQLALVSIIQLGVLSSGLLCQLDLPAERIHARRDFRISIPVAFARLQPQ